MATSPALPALGLGLSSSGGPSLGFVPPAITWSLRLASSRPSTRPRISTRLLFVRGIDRLCNLLSTFTGEATVLKAPKVYMMYTRGFRLLFHWTRLYAVRKSLGNQMLR
ncbi:unnamed protein product, partial [Vitis vinifera]